MKINIVENQSLPNGEKGSVGYVNNTDDVFYLIPPVKTMNTLNYVYSMWVKVDEDREIKVTQGCVEQVSATVKGGEWTRVVLKFTADGKEVFIELAPGIYYLYQAQLEQGTIASDWDRKTTDVIDETKSEITQLADSVSVAVKELSEGIEKNSAEILVQKGQIELKVSEGDVSSSLSLEKGDIRLVGNRIAIDSDFFKLTNDGEIEATAGKVGSLNVNNNELEIVFDNINGFPIDPDTNMHYFGRTYEFYNDTEGEEKYIITRIYPLKDFDNTFFFINDRDKFEGSEGYSMKVDWQAGQGYEGSDIVDLSIYNPKQIKRVSSIDHKEYDMGDVNDGTQYKMRYYGVDITKDKSEVCYILSKQGNDDELLKYYYVSQRYVTKDEIPCRPVVLNDERAVEVTLHDTQGNFTKMYYIEETDKEIHNIDNKITESVDDLADLTAQMIHDGMVVFKASEEGIIFGGKKKYIKSVSYVDDLGGSLEGNFNSIETDNLYIEDAIDASKNVEYIDVYKHINANSSITSPVAEITDTLYSTNISSGGEANLGDAYFNGKHAEYTEENYFNPISEEIYDMVQGVYEHSPKLVCGHEVWKALQKLQEQIDALK